MENKVVAIPNYFKDTVNRTTEQLLINDKITANIYCLSRPIILDKWRKKKEEKNGNRYWEHMMLSCTLSYEGDKLEAHEESDILFSICEFISNQYKAIYGKYTKVEYSYSSEKEEWVIVIK